jgi:hypothetical protein
MKTQKHVPSELEKRLDIAQHVPSLAKLSVLAIVITVGACFAWQFSKGSRRATLTSGPLSNHHRLIENSCERCHPSAFRGTPDQACVECHKMPEHAAAMPKMIAAHPEQQAKCASCHKEHHGMRSLVPADSPMCTGCHMRINQLLPGTEQASFGDFDHHPEFAVHGWVGMPPTYRRVRLGETTIRSETQIKFSHKKHMALTDGNKSTLECASCHETAEDNKTFRPMSYPRHCERCHLIDFDERLKGQHVPHGKAENVLPFVTGAIVKLHFDAGEKGDEARVKIEKESADDEAALFTEGGGCNRCHDVEDVAAADSPDKKHHYNVAQPKIPERWMPAARFSHPVHRFVSCDECHGNRSESTSASDINLPGIARCRQCHADPPAPGKVASPCLQCHGYHSDEPLEKKPAAVKPAGP